MTFDELVAEGAAVPVEGWDFSWFSGRATEERPSWGYSKLMADRMSRAEAALDIQTGGGEVLAEIPKPPDLLMATEAWKPNLGIARRNLAHLDAWVVHAEEDGPLPFPDGTFDLVVSRHPVVTRWDEVGRVLRAGGTYLSQQVGMGTLREITDFMTGPQPVGDERSTERAVAGLAAAGLTVVDLRSESMRVEFFDVGAVVHFLRKVVWAVPDFTVEGYRDRLVAMHEHIGREGAFVTTSERFLVEARKN
ncbi:methyltransferase domain-containing protein [Saccharothrix sp. HUAS TT1]|uniref:methyltransferase domain-containing protein n=1 Tax=unclassified Saccharothrix TaxID=2593673 RepID=UPI00345C473A